MSHRRTRDLVLSRQAGLAAAAYLHLSALGHQPERLVAVLVSRGRHRLSDWIVVLSKAIPWSARGSASVLRNTVSSVGIRQRLSFPLLACRGSFSVSGLCCAAEFGCRGSRYRLSAKNCRRGLRPRVFR